MNWIEAHRKSEELAALAEGALRAGEYASAIALYRDAGREEAHALSMVSPETPKTMGVSAVSAAALYFKAKEYDLAERLAVSCLARDDMPEFASEQLKGILQTVWNERLFRASGVEFVRGELIVGVAGGLVAVGAAPLDLVHRKVEEVKNLFFRAVEMLLDLPLRIHGAPASELREQFRPWMVQAPAGSYQFALRVEKPKQFELFAAATPDVEEVTNRLFGIVSAAATGSIEAIEDRIPREDYRDCFIKQVRNLAPTGKTFERLTIKATGREDLAPAVFSVQSRRVLTDSLRARTPMSPEETSAVREQLVGILRGVQLDKDWIEIAEERSQQTIRILQAGDAIDDIVGPLVNHKVTVDVTRHSDGRRSFLDIQSYE